jgi:tellurite methyltransferase
MKNEKYWNEFYRDQNVSLESSKFAIFVDEYLNQISNLADKSILDIACGNGRDSKFFKKKGYNITGIDKFSIVHSSDFQFIKRDIFEMNSLNEFLFFYMRFFFHTLEEAELDNLLLFLSQKISNPNSLLFIETRSIRGIVDKEEKKETYFKSAVGDVHFRMLYSNKYLISKILRYFDIIYFYEGKNLSVYGEEDPYCQRLILKKM